jgi:predicted PolB exonuclease-like 3'-5' exonuclease
MLKALVFDVETVVDADMARRVLGEEDLSDEEAVHRVAGTREDGQQRAFPKPLYHRVVEIAVCLVQGDGTVAVLRPLSERDRGEHDERTLLEAFWHGLASWSAGKARLVTFNGRRFDIPVLVHRALLHGISPAPWWLGDYRKRYGESHVDLMDFLADFGSSVPLQQHEMAVMLGVPGKLGLSGGDVRQLWSEAKGEDIAAYCTCDVATLTLSFARVGPHAGWCTSEESERMEASVRERLAALAEGHALYRTFLRALD